MRRILLLAFPVIVAVLPVVAIKPASWGPTVGGVRTGIVVSSGPDAAIQMTVQSVGDRPLLLTVGNLIGTDFYDFRFRVVVTTPDGKSQRVIYTGGPAAVGGRIDPLVVPLIPKASYTVQIPLALFYVLDGSEKLDTFILRRCQMRIELDVQNAVCPLYGYPNPNMIPCWHGKVVSNSLQFPN